MLVASSSSVLASSSSVLHPLALLFLMRPGSIITDHTFCAVCGYQGRLSRLPMARAFDAAVRILTD